MNKKTLEPQPDFNDFEKGPGVYHINWVSNEYFSAGGMQKHLNNKENKK